MESTIFFEDATTTRTLKNIKTTLKKTLKSMYNIEDDAVADEILKIHGLTKDNFDFISMTERYLRNKIINDVSIDDNSNKTEKAIGATINELMQPVAKAVGYDYLYREMVDLYGKKEAKRLAGEMYALSLAISDSSKIMTPYCWALDASKIVSEGRPFGQVHSLPPKRLSSYIAALNETIHQMSSHLAGAIAIGSFFLDAAHMIRIKEGYSFEDLQDPEVRKYIENCYQNFVYSVNHLSRNGIESPFTNISVFDRPKIRSFLRDMAYYFDPEMFNSQVTPLSEDEWVEYIIEIQNIFIDFFDAGDPVHGGMPFRFPVCTLNLSKNDTGGIIDTVFFNEVTKRDIYRYNIYSSAGSKVASCCRLLSDVEMLDIAGQSNSFGGAGAISLGSHRVVTINYNRIALESQGDVKRFHEIHKERIKDAVKILKAHKELIYKLAESGLQPFITRGWINMSRMFSTIGILGITEAPATLNLQNKEDRMNFMKEVLIELNDEAEKMGKENALIVNIEQIPAESMSHRLPKADALIFGDRSVKYPLYSNQFIPLWEDVTLWERMDIDGMYNKLITGGGIVHFSLGEKTTATQNRNIIKYAVKSGCEHFALNSVYTVCEEGHSHFGNHSKCPKCGSVELKHFTRTVGFFTEVESWNYHKREFDFKKRAYKGIDR